MIRTHINVFVGGDRATLATPVPEGATIHVIPAVSGG
jgi:molybdopterin converting factor small subunit